MEKRSVPDFYRAIGFFDKSISHDPTNVLSYVETVECYLLLYFFDDISYSEIWSRIKPILSILSNLNQHVDVAQALFGGIKLYLEWDFVEAEKHLKYAVDLNQSCLVVLSRYAGFLIGSGRHSEALKLLHKMTHIDPMSVLTSKRIGRFFWQTGQYESALVYLEEAIELEPSDYEANVLSGAVLSEMGRFDEAIEMFDRSLKTQPNLEALSMIGYTNALTGKNDKARQIIAEIEAQSKNEYTSALKLARIYLALGEKDMAYALLDTAFQEHEVDLIALGCDPRWKSIRHEPRFKALMVKVGLPVSNATLQLTSE